MKLLSGSRFLLVLALLLLPVIATLPMTTQAYTSCEGIERNDVVTVDYVGTKQSNGEEFDSGDDVDFTISPERLIEGFYQGMLGLKVGERDTIVVPPSQGYSSGELAGETLVFEVFIEAIVSGERPCGDGSGDGSFGTAFLNFMRWVAILGAVGFVAVYGYFAVQKNTTPKCAHCVDQGREERFSEGKCGKCGKYYCRQSFSRGCPNCGSNTFVPNK